jgi:hypothetical protein
MSIVDYPYLISAWQSLSPINKTFFLLFCGVSIYTISLSVHVLLVLHSFKKQRVTKNANPSRPPLAILGKRLWNLRQLHLFALYLFGFCIVVQIPNVFRVGGDSKGYPFHAITSELTFLFYCDAIIFLVFTLLHTVQWFVSARVDSFASMQND